MRSDIDEELVNRYLLGSANLVEQEIVEGLMEQDPTFAEEIHELQAISERIGEPVPESIPGSLLQQLMETMPTASDIDSREETIPVPWLIAYNAGTATPLQQEIIEGVMELNPALRQELALLKALPPWETTSAASAPKSEAVSLLSFLQDLFQWRSASPQLILTRSAVALCLLLILGIVGQFFSHRRTSDVLKARLTQAEQNVQREKQERDRLLKEQRTRFQLLTDQYIAAQKVERTKIQAQRKKEAENIARLEQRIAALTKPLTLPSPKDNTVARNEETLPQSIVREFSHFPLLATMRGSEAVAQPTFPLEGQALLDPYPTFTWKKTKDVVSVDIEVFRAKQSFLKRERLTDTHYVFMTPLPPGEYSWQVSAHDANGGFIGRFRESGVFTVITPQEQVKRWQIALSYGLHRLAVRDFNGATAVVKGLHEELKHAETLTQKMMPVQKTMQTLQQQTDDLENLIQQYRENEVAE